MIKTESFRLFAALAIVIGGAAALFFTFHSLAADSNIQSEQSGVPPMKPVFARLCGESFLALFLP